MGKRPWHQQWKRAPREQRTVNGTVYASKAEARRAQQLTLMVKAGQIQGWRRQVKIPLGEDFSTVVDFVVTKLNGHERAEEVKGFETTRFGDVRRLWPKYGPYPLRILKLCGQKKWNEETIKGAVAHA